MNNATHELEEVSSNPPPPLCCTGTRKTATTSIRQPQCQCTAIPGQVADSQSRELNCEGEDLNSSPVSSPSFPLRWKRSSSEIPSHLSFVKYVLKLFFAVMGRPASVDGFGAIAAVRGRGARASARMRTKTRCTPPSHRTRTTSRDRNNSSPSQAKFPHGHPVIHHHPFPIFTIYICE